MSWLPGTTMDDWRSNPERVDQLTGIVRQLHDLTAEMVQGEECVVHDDLQARNVVIHNGSLGLIDWEQLRTGRRVEDAAQLCWSFAGPSDREDVGEVGRRWRRILDVYQMTDRTDVVSVAIAKIAGCVDDIIREASLGSARHRRLKDRGDHLELMTVHDWLADNKNALTTALT